MISSSRRRKVNNMAETLPPHVLVEHARRDMNELLKEADENIRTIPKEAAEKFFTDVSTLLEYVPFGHPAARLLRNTINFVDAAVDKVDEFDEQTRRKMLDDADNMLRHAADYVITDKPYGKIFKKW